MSVIGILGDLFLSIALLLLVVFAVYAFKNMRTVEGQLEYRILTASIIIFIVASSVGIIDVLLTPGSIWAFIAFIIWVLGLLALIVREARRWLGIKKANVTSLVRLLTLYSDTKYYLVSILLLTFITLPLWLLLLSRPLRVISTWLDIVGISMWTLAILNLAIAERKSYQNLRSRVIVPGRKVAPLARNDMFAVTAYGSFVNLFLARTKHVAGNATTNTLAEYFEFNPILFEGCRLSDDGIIEIDPILQNLDRITEENRIPTISTLFSMLNYKLMNLCSVLVSSKWTQKTMEDCYLFIEGQFDDKYALSIILKTMPKGVLEDKKLSFLSKEELEVRVRERTLELEKSEQQLGILKDFHEDIVKKAPVGILRTDKEGRIEFVNPKAAKLIGLPNGEEITITTKGKKINDIFSVKEAQKTMSFEIGSPEHMEHLAHSVPGEELYTNLALTSIYGKKAQTSVCVVSLSGKDGKFDGALFLIEDITERKQAEEALKASEENFRHSLDDSPLGIHIVNAGGETLYANRATLDICGFASIEEFKAATPPIKSYAMESYAEYQKRKEKRERGEHVPYNYEISIVRKDGEVRHLQVLRKEVLWDGKPQLQLIYEDITERKKLQEQLMAQDRLATIGQLTSGIAHELNNPLTVVIGFTELLLQRELPDDIRADLKLVSEGATRTARIVKNLLTFARKQPQEKLPVDIKDSVQRVLELRAYEQKVSNIQVNTRFASDLPHIIGNTFQLQQVFLNLVINAEFFMIEAHNKGTLTITTERIGDFVRVSFADDGPGIPQENMRNLFIPFFTTKEVGKGTGLGLSICHGIITEHGGKIYAESEPGKGATFIIELPVKEASAR